MRSSVTSADLMRLFASSALRVTSLAKLAMSLSELLCRSVMRSRVRSMRSRRVFGHDVFVPAGVWGLLVAALGAIVKSDYYFRIYQ